MPLTNGRAVLNFKIDGYLKFKRGFYFKTVVDAFINTMKTTFDFNFDLYQAVKEDRCRYS